MDIKDNFLTITPLGRFDGVRTSDLGITIPDFPVLSPAKPVVLSEHVPGRNGNVQFFTGSYENRTLTVKGFLTVPTPEKMDDMVTRVNALLMAEPGYQQVQINDLPWILHARAMDTIPYDVRGGHILPFTLHFDCKPQRYDFPDEAVQLDTLSTEIINPYGTVARPIFAFAGSPGQVIQDAFLSISAQDHKPKRVGFKTITSGAEVNCETYEVKGDFTGFLSVDYPVLWPGKNTVTFGASSGVDFFVQFKRGLWRL